ncbi:CBS domain-containing protein [Sphingorhabdus sp.]|uniref:CBS domain-containing protein n=1 Tax=Sphingorhabdus sp. TaxID=1902408 RepID=UPI0035B38780
MKASDIMTWGAATVQVDASLEVALRMMISHHISALPVVDGDNLLKGVVTEGDFFRPQALPNDLDDLLSMPAGERMRALAGAKVGEIMSRDPVDIDAEATVRDALALMERHAVKRLPVTSDGKVVGLISRADLLSALVS